MKEKITGIISFLGGIGFILYFVYIVIDKGGLVENQSFTFFSVLLYFISVILYVVWTKLGKKDFSDLEKMDYENQLLKRQIEQKELKKKLEE